MNRKLHNSLIAVTASGAMLAFALLVGSPLDATPSTAPAFASEASGQAEPAIAAPPAAGQASLRRARQSVRMPFFSFFLPRG